MMGRCSYQFCNLTFAELNLRRNEYEMNMTPNIKVLTIGKAMRLEIIYDEWAVARKSSANDR